MRENEILLNPNPLVRYLKKPASEFTREDLIQFIEENGIEMINFRYVPEDGKLKSLNFIIGNRDHLERILTAGERVDGSSLFSYIDPHSSDLYLIPRYRTAFVNPFSDIPSLEIMASFYTSEGIPFEGVPGTILRKAHKVLLERTGFQLMVFGELEYYVNGRHERKYSLEDHKGYHQTAPFAKFEFLRLEALRLIAMTGAPVKYGHSEVGCFSSETEDFEQHEIEFLPAGVEEAADYLHIAKWILRMLSETHGLEVSFAPKISEGRAGSGLHVHMMLLKDGKNAMTGEEGLSVPARKLIAGILDLSGALMAFGNTVPVSYLRLVPHQEAPTTICWGKQNRSVLVRVPLGWIGTGNMMADANPLMKNEKWEVPDRQTVEFRVPDGSADICALFAGLVMAVLHGLEMEEALSLAESLCVDHPSFDGNPSDLKHLPTSCHDSAILLREKRKYFEREGVFSSVFIDHVIEKLLSFQDELLSERLAGNQEEIHQLVLKYIHYR